MIVHNKSKNRRSFRVGKHVFNLIHGDNTVPESKEIIKFATLHPDLTIIKDSSEPRPSKADKKKRQKKKNKSLKDVIKEKPKEESINEPKEEINSNPEE